MHLHGRRLEHRQDVDRDARQSEMTPSTRIMKTIVATMYGFRSDALINHIRRSFPRERGAALLRCH